MPDERRADHIDLHERLASLESTVTSTNTLLTRLDEKLFGNGTTGVIERISDRVSSLENWKYYVVGVVSIFGLLASAIEVYAHFKGGR